MFLWEVGRVPTFHKINSIKNSKEGNKNLIKKISSRYNSQTISEIPYSKEIIESYSKGSPIKTKEIQDIIKNIT